ncbi:MAG: anti-sigma factor domain-containing protein [Hyphomicrobiaceae bacterium]
MNVDSDIDGLSAEYVLGSLSEEERHAIEARRGADPELDRAIRTWERRLQPLVLGVPDRTPPPFVRERLLLQIKEVQALEAKGASATRDVARLRRQVGRLKTQLLVASTMAASLLAIAGWHVLFRPLAHPLVAIIAPVAPGLAADESLTAQSRSFVLVVEPESRRVSLRLASGLPPSEGRAYQLWVRARSDTPPKAITRLGPGHREVRSILRADEITEIGAGELIVSEERHPEVPPKVPMSAVLAHGRLSR